jgi:2-polyprenyl-3-methyl-5-hydroxy-6-metoxy-1,4-benzoquinol methylase
LLRNEDGNYFGAGGDGALLYSLLEVCEPNEIKCIQRILVEYNDLNSLNDYKVNGEEQTENQLKIRNMTKQTTKIVEEVSQKTYEIKENMTETLQEVHQDVINREPKAIEVYKEAITNRTDTWIDNIDTENIKIRQDWLIHKFKELNIPKKAKILDVGSWTGNFINTFYKMGYEDITCLDISTETVRLGKEAFPYFNWICDDIEKYDTHERYDVIIVFEVLEHLVYPLNVINKLKSLLTPTGKIFLTIPTEDVVFENGKNCEHISKIEEEPISIICDYYDIIESTNCRWYAGYLAKFKNVEDKPIEKRILIATPTAKYMEMETFSSIFNLTKPRNMEVDFQYFYGYNIAQVRNLIAHYAVENKYDYVLWVDSDIVLPKDALLKMLNYKKDMITGVYIQRFTDRKVPEIYIANNNNIVNAKIEDVMENKVMEIAGCGFGCVLTTVDMLKNIGYPQFEYHNALDHKDTLSEDVDFCIKAMRKNYKMYVDTSIKCEHIGATKFVV